MTKQISFNAKAALTYKAIADIAQEMDNAGQSNAADRLVECLDELSQESLVRFYDIMSEATRSAA